MRAFLSSRPTLLVLALLLTTATAQAQMSPMGGGMSGGMGGGRSGNRMHGSGSGGDSAMADNPAELPAQQRFTELEGKLKLNDAQRPLWNNYQDKVSALHADLMRAPSAATLAKDSATHQIDRKVDQLRNRLAALEDIADAARTLYQALTPEQKQVADSLLADTVPSLYDRFTQLQERNGKTGTDRGGPPPRSKEPN